MTTIVSVVGTIGTIPKLTRSVSQTAFCTFRVASTTRRYDRDAGSWVDGDTSWYTVNAFRGLAEHADASFSRGDRVIVSGRLRVRPWKTDDRSGTNVEIEADALGHDLRWGTTRFQAETSVTPEPVTPKPAAPELETAGTGGSAPGRADAGFTTADSSFVGFAGVGSASTPEASGPEASGPGASNPEASSPGASSALAGEAVTGDAAA